MTKECQMPNVKAAARTTATVLSFELGDSLVIMACFQNLQMFGAGVRPSSGAATSVGQKRMELRRTCSWRTWLWPGTATLRILKTRPSASSFVIRLPIKLKTAWDQK
jgi:hypothetical protein